MTEEEMDRPSLVVLVRHAESLRNRVKKNNKYLPKDESSAIIRGVPDHRIPITEFGIQQSVITGVKIRERFGVFDVAYKSGYLRTEQTLDGILSAYTDEERAQTKIRVSDFIRERRAGYTYDMTTEEAQAAFPYLDECWERDGPFYAVPPGGESQNDVCRITFHFVGLLKRQRPGKKVLVVLHGGSKWGVRYNVEGWTPDEYIHRYEHDPRPENCGVTTYRYSEKTGRLELEDYNVVYWKESAAA
jgi:broad specificity phosphatase PhoE